MTFTPAQQIAWCFAAGLLLALASGATSWQGTLFFAGVPAIGIHEMCWTEKRNP